MQKVVLATGNPGKVAELSELLKPLQKQIIAQSEFAVEDADETGTTFVENAIIKARHAAKITGLAAIADDSGLAVDYLNGAPGLYSSRYAGANANDHDNVLKLLEALKDVPSNQRGAEFHCVLVYLRHAEDPAPLICHGKWRGTITTDIHGAGGFGYDPVFWVEQHQATSAQISKADKNALSHRGKALRQLLTQMEIEAC
ncbi:MULTISPECIES: RdgB/HAM1 family non-canonical purine NTP pyrophosphatase [unclassified Agarivorans]|uniref:RdgB/HAM1 family non-canonical purine NTP pyrophosphatase n=1 Tax=unclassified Agarivorans TaxID=2636026 RepID=UPI0026E3FBF8|nr:MULTISPECIES: RdgB/HAM1 family non-canonical purine NTP pyrophosphatase [unclassified Agarivorans]MDO6685149.1 RdgB/HAM1 family non-canonical purine NTP pyrophosphatase [Agarivorans sp. 3_MG-2023]MDO6715679.1 RdgB/HAM1 family non-canonical purine NTP pyrophosphatase [Agarivorans sp. 2_MG-2023]